MGSEFEEIDERLRRADKSISDAIIRMNVLYGKLVGRIMEIWSKAVRDGGATLVDDIRNFQIRLSKELESAKDPEIRRDLELLIEMLRNFIIEYENALRAGSFESYEQRINSMIIPIKSTLKQTLLRHFKDKSSRLKIIEEEIRKGEL